MAVVGKVRAGLASHPTLKCQPRDSSWKRVGGGDREWWGVCLRGLESKNGCPLWLQGGRGGQVLGGECVC